MVLINFIETLLSSLGLGKFCHFSPRYVDRLNEYTKNGFKFKLKESSDKHIVIVSDSDNGVIVIELGIKEMGIIDTINIKFLDDDNTTSLTD